MKDSLILVSSLFIGLVLISSGFVIHASASGNWVGNDNGEFGYPSCGGCKLDYGDAEIDASFTNNMAYTSPNGYVSLQYTRTRIHPILTKQDHGMGVTIGSKVRL